MRLNQVTVFVSDIPRAVEFYRRLGLSPVVLDAHYARFACPDGASTFSVEYKADATPGDTLVYFECDDLDERVTALKVVGVIFDTALVDQPWLWREARLRDPDGNRLCLFHAGENRLNPPWRVHEDDA
jgi:catechol 2,3-dioxygenase-like lactoylglutathione lyase family enzyme